MSQTAHESFHFWANDYVMVHPKELRFGPQEIIGELRFKLEVQELFQLSDWMSTITHNRLFVVSLLRDEISVKSSVFLAM